MQPVSRYLTSFDFVDDMYIFLNASKIFINYDINRLFNTYNFVWRNSFFTIFNYLDEIKILFF